MDFISRDEHFGVAHGRVAGARRVGMAEVDLSLLNELGRWRVKDVERAIERGDVRRAHLVRTASSASCLRMRAGPSARRT